MGLDGLTPAMKQYLGLKERYRDCILLFRMGDFYEMFFDDAVTASRVLEITLTSRDKQRENAIPLCGFPYHAAATYIARLIDAGYKVAVCEQLEDPRMAKGIVKRDVVRVITPGLVVDPETLDAHENNFLAAYYARNSHQGLSFIDISTGEFYVAELDTPARIKDFSTLKFREILLPEAADDSPLKELWDGALIDPLPESYFSEETALECLGRYLSPDTIRDLALHHRPWMAAPAQAVLRYVEETQKEHLPHVSRLEEYAPHNFLVLDTTCQKTLELFGNLRDGRKQGSLIHLLDETMTAMGGRRLRWWLHFPLMDPLKIRERLAAVTELKERHLVRADLRRILSKVYDLERLGGRIGLEVATARDLIALKTSLAYLPELRHLLEVLETDLLKAIHGGIDEMGDMRAIIDHALVDDPPLGIRDGGIIRCGYSPELDELVDIARHGKTNIAALEEQERKRTGIANLKVRYNTVFGYYIEVTKAHAHLVPPDYVRKQTLVNAERYTTPLLKDYEHAVLTAEEHSRALEYDLFIDLRRQMATHIRRIQQTASFLADLDVLISLAEVAVRYDYTCPIVDDGPVIQIREGRHPVVERVLSGERFVPNDTLLDDENNRFLVITGPNMAGKSTYIRQVALITIMAQMGSFVPAREARIGIADHLFTRIGSADNLSQGQSTFMVEMMEVAHILKNATPRSLIILDEVGRGTSTFDGLSIAWAVAEFIVDRSKLGARTLFATHYHQLIELASQHPGVKNYNVAVREWGDRIIFLHRIEEGGASRSFGIQVAKLAGLPEEVIVRAGEVLTNLEREELDPGGRPRLSRHRSQGGEPPAEKQVPLFMTEEERIAEEIKGLNLDRITPLEALTIVYGWQTRLGAASDENRRG